MCLNCFTYCKGTGADISQVSSRAANKKEGRCCLCSKVMVRGVGDDDGEQPNLTDVLKIEELESKLSDSDLGKRLLEQWQLTQVCVCVRVCVCVVHVCGLCVCFHHLFIIVTPRYHPCSHLLKATQRLQVTHNPVKIPNPHKRGLYTNC